MLLVLHNVGEIALLIIRSQQEGILLRGSGCLSMPAAPLVSTELSILVI